MRRAVGLAALGALICVAGLSVAAVFARAEDATVVLWHAYGDEEEAGLREAITAFETGHPGVHVDVVRSPFGAYATKLRQAIPSGNGPDVFIDVHDRLPSYRESGLLEPVAPAEAADFEPEVLEALTLDGVGLGVPLQWKCLVLFVNLRLAMGVDLSSLESIRRAERTPGITPLAWEVGNAYASAGLFHAFGAELLDERGHYALVGEGAERALGLLDALVADGTVPDEASGALVGDLFTERRAMTAISGPWMTTAIAGRNWWEVRPLPPAEPGGPPMEPFSTVEAAMIARGARAPELARALAQFLGSVEGSVARGRSGHIVANRAAWDEPRLESEARWRAFYDAARSARPMPSHRLMSSTFLPAERAFRRVLRGDAEPAAALEEGRRRFEDETRPPPAARDPLWFSLAVGLFGLLLALALARKLSDPDVRAALARSRTAYAWTAHAFVAVALLVVLPLVVGALTSFFAEVPDETGETTRRFVGTAHYLDILTARGGDLLGHGSFYAVLLVTVLWTIANLIGHLGIGVSLALVLSRPAMKLKGLYRVLLVLPWAVPSYVTALAWRGMFHRQLGAINALLDVVGVEPVSWFAHFSTAFSANVITNVWLGFPFMMVVTLGALTSIPADVYEAASVDGASARQQFFRITLPLLVPALLPAVLMGAVWTFNMFNVVFLVSSGEPDGSTEILVSEAYRWAFTRGHQTGYAAAYAVLIFGVLILGTRLLKRASQKAA